MLVPIRTSNFTCLAFVFFVIIHFEKDCIPVKLIYNIALIFSVQQWFSYIYIYVFHIFLRYGVSQDIEYSFLCYIIGPCFIHFIYTSLHLLIPTPNPCLFHHPRPLATTSLVSMYVSLFLFSRYVHLCHVLDSTCEQYHTVFVFSFWLPSLVW